MRGTAVWHNIAWEKAVELLRTHPRQGLTEAEVKKRREKHGKNELPREKPLSQLKIFLEQFKSPLIYILLIAGGVTLLLAEYADFIVILASVIINVLIGYAQEAKSSRALSELKKVLSAKAIVFRAGKEREILAEELVPGDIFLLKPGDRVPADGRLISSHNLKINEAALTGEWMPAGKITKSLSKNTPLADRDNMVCMGTGVEEGYGRAVVVGTATATEIGKITSLVRETREEKTPYQKKLARFSRIIGLVVVVICLFIFLEGVLTGGEFVEMFTTAVAVAVSAIPEGLPVAMTVILAVGMQKIYRKKGLVRKLAAAETLGSTSVIATDKTGTLTEGKMTVAGIYARLSHPEETTLRAALLCSHAFIENPDDAVDSWKVVGSPTEKAITLAAAKIGLFRDRLAAAEPQLDEIPFSSQYKYAASWREVSARASMIYAKGAPEIILAKAKHILTDAGPKELSDVNRQALNKKYEELTEKGYRVLGVALKNVRGSTATADLKKYFKDLVFVGFIYLEDPIRPGAKEAIRVCRQAGMLPIIITGDHRLTAQAVARQLGIDAKDKNILEGKDLDKMTDAELSRKLRSIRIYARVEPAHKLRIIEAWQKKGQVVAMTGDGINDAPALKKADIGVALGSGTEVAEEVSDIVLLTDDFSVIVAAVEEGRAILDNIRKVMTYLLSDSFAEIILIGVSIIAGLPLPVTAVQILWINLIGDGLPNLALAFEPKEKDLMKMKPASRNVPLLTREMKIIIFIIGAITNLVLIYLSFWLWHRYSDPVFVRTMIFTCLAIDTIFYVFSCKSLRRNVWHINILINKFLLGAWFLSLLGLLAAIYLPILNSLLNTAPLPLSSWYVILALGLGNTILIEAVKYYFIVRHQTDA